MILSEEEVWQLKLIRLAREVQRNHSDLAIFYSYHPISSFNQHEFAVYKYSDNSIIVCNEDNKNKDTAEKSYKWLLNECKKKGLIDEGYGD
jgi:hypothetical protein